MAEGSSTPLNSDKPVIVRVKRKAFQYSLDSFWLEIHERPLKRPLVDFEKLSISDASSSRVEELKTKKILVQHVETVVSSEDTFDVLRSFVPNSSDGLELKSKEKHEEGRRNIKTVNKQDHLLTKAKQRQEILSRNARFEQIWRSRKGKKEAPEDEAIYEMCRLYDVVRVDVEEHEVDIQKEKNTELEDCRMMAEYLPLLREVLPPAAVEIEDDIRNTVSKQASSDGYVYDLYAVKEDTNMVEAESASLFPLVQVDDDEDYYDGPDDSEYETDDSNAENYPLNDYPDEGISEDEDEVASQSSDEESETESESRTSGSQSEGELESGSQVSYEYKYDHSGPHDLSDNADQFMDDELYSDGDDEHYWQ